jgi:hypothetical protein
MRKQNKNYTLYWMAGISLILSIPIDIIIVRNVQADNIVKSVMIMIVFLVLLFAVMLLYKYIFGVSVQEITQEEKVSEIDRLFFKLTDCSKQYSNQKINQCMKMACEQLQRFKRRKNVMLHVAGIDNQKDGSALEDLVQIVEDALLVYVERVIKRIEIFDDQGVPEIVNQNIKYIEEQLRKTDELLIDFETLITETSHMGETQEEKDISKLKDVVNAMKSLRTDQKDEIELLAEKYD